MIADNLFAILYLQSLCRTIVTTPFFFHTTRKIKNNALNEENGSKIYFEGTPTNIDKKDILIFSGSVGIKRFFDSLKTAELN